MPSALILKIKIPITIMFNIILNFVSFDIFLFCFLCFFILFSPFLIFFIIYYNFFICQYFFQNFFKNFFKKCFIFIISIFSCIIHLFCDIINVAKLKVQFVCSFYRSTSVKSVPIKLYRGWLQQNFSILLLFLKEGECYALL